MPEQSLHSTSELFVQLATGSQAALYRIMLIYEKMLLRRIEQILHNEELTKEVFADTIHALWVNKEEVAERNNPIAWMVVTARHKAINKIRDEKRKNTFPLELFSNIESSVRIEIELEKKELRKLIEIAEEKLSQQEKLVYTLRIKDGLSRKEIAQKLNVSENTVRNQVRSALINLRKNLSKMISTLFI